MSESATRVRVDPVRAQATTARLMATANREIPTFHLRVRVPAGGLRRRAIASGGSLTSAVLGPVARWLTEFPRLNGHLGVDSFIPSPTVDLGLAVSHGESVLVVVTLRDCGSWSDRDFADAMAGIRQRNSENAFTRADFTKPTFTLSNLGMYGVEDFTSIITPPQVAVLSMAAVSDMPLVAEGRVMVGEVLPLTLGVDHRVVDGAYAAQALRRLKSSLSATHVHGEPRGVVASPATPLPDLGSA
jgi:pyruvate dehydrogenase E2 component (dihydrolipoamide acetyltransferase)